MLADGGEWKPGKQMLRGFWKLTWVEIKIFVREPMGVVATVGIPVILFLLLGRVFSFRAGASSFAPGALSGKLPVLASILMALSAVTSLIAIMSIYREGGILKRLRATPLRPWTILGAHVVVKLTFTGAALVLLVMAGRRFYPAALDVNLASFALALLLSTLSILSVGFVVASIVPTARFAQPIGSAVFYPMLAMSGLFFQLDMLSPPWQFATNLLPVTHAVSLLQGIWAGAGWWEHWPEIGALALNFAVCTAVSAKVFRWE